MLYLGTFSSGIGCPGERIAQNARPVLQPSHDRPKFSRQVVAEKKSLAGSGSIQAERTILEFNYLFNNNLRVQGRVKLEDFE